MYIIIIIIITSGWGGEGGFIGWLLNFPATC